MPRLFDPLPLRGVTLRNRIGVSPMCQYSCTDGFATDWHLVHLGSRAVGGAGLVMAEATAVEPRGRISPGDLGIWSDAHIEPLARVARFIAEHGAVPAIQLAHAGRKASTAAPWDGGRPVAPDAGGWQPVAPSPLPFRADELPPAALSEADIDGLLDAFRQAARRALAAGFTCVELHAAHGYLAHSFYSPLSNARTDRWGGSFEGRTRFVRGALRAIREVWPADLPVMVRLSCSDWAPGGWTLADSVALARLLREDGCDLVDCSSGGGVADARIPAGAGYQVPFAEAVRAGAGLPTAAVGLITDAAQADQIVRNQQADLVLLARAELRDPYWPIHAAHALGHPERAAIPRQYLRGF